MIVVCLCTADHPKSSIKNISMEIPSFSVSGTGPSVRIEGKMKKVGYG